MNDFDYYAVVYDNEIYCLNCLPVDVTVQSEEITPIFAGSEWDEYPVCCVCGHEHDYVIKLENNYES